MAVRRDMQAHCRTALIGLKCLTACLLAFWPSACPRTAMRTALLALAFIMTLGPAASGQRLYWGVIGGTNLTPDFPRYEMSTPADMYGNPADTFEHLPGPHSFILGGMLEVQLISGLSIEADALYRSLPGISFNTVFPVAGGSSVTTRFTTPSAN